MKENKPKKHKNFPVWLSIIGFIAGTLSYTIFKGPNKTIPIKINNKTYNLEIADTQMERSLGLMNRKKLPKNRGMLFIFPEEGKHSFWMYKTKIPLDIIWLDLNWNVVHVENNVPPCPHKGPIKCESYRPDENAKYVIELAASEISKR